MWADGSSWKFYVACNSRGDVTAIYAADGTLRAKYTYDSWGNTVSIIDRYGNDIVALGDDAIAADNIGALNRIRYRGYYYDSESGLYYLQSRYYDPQVKRFLNADGYVSTGQGLLASNMFAYCLNNPVNMADSSGCSPYQYGMEPDLGVRQPTIVRRTQKLFMPKKIYDVPLYDQGNRSLCWAYSQVMVEDYTTSVTRTQYEADLRAKELAVSINGEDEWNRGAWPTNMGEWINVDRSISVEILWFLLSQGPVYAYYNNGKSAHLVVVTGVNPWSDVVYTNNPHGYAGEQIVENFFCGYYMRNKNDMPLGAIILIQ